MGYLEETSIHYDLRRLEVILSFLVDQNRLLLEVLLYMS